MKRIILSSATVSLLLVGCGGGGGSSSSNTLKEVKVIDSYVVNAKVCDSKGHCGFTDEKGTARANFDLNTTLTSIGGFIDANGNGVKDSNELEAPLFVAPANATVLTPLTTLIAKGASLDKLSEILEVSKDEILHTDPMQTNNVKLIKAFNAVYPVIKENQIKELVLKINNYKPNASLSDLPNFSDDNINVNIYYLAKSVLVKEEDKKFVDEVEASSSYDAKSLSKNLETAKQNIEIKEIVSTKAPEIEANLSEEVNGNAEKKEEEVKNSVNELNETITNNNKNSENNITKPTEKPVANSSNGKTDLPDFDSDYKPKDVKLEEPKSDLPDFSDNNVSLIPTNNDYNPSYTPLPKKYYAKLNAYDKFVELKKIDDKNYQFLSEQYFNILQVDFNATKFFDMNVANVFDDVKITPDGFLKGTLFLNLKDLNSSNEVNFSQNTTYKVLNGKITLDKNISKLMKNYNENAFEQVNHNYQFKIDYNISGTILSLSGKYGVIKAVSPTISFNENSYIVPKNSDINISVGTSNVPNASCEVSGSGLSLKCYVDNSKNIYVFGKTPDEEAIKVATITLNNQGYKTSKSFYLEVLKPADKVIVENWDLTKGNYQANHIKMNLTGSLNNNLISVSSSATPLSGSPENNVTVYLFNAQNDTNNYVRFIFDANVYGSNDWFVIKRGDNKEIKFRVGDIDISNNTFYFK